MITKNISTLKIHKLTQEQYERELAAGNIDENALYLTPGKEITLESLGAASSSDLDALEALVGETSVVDQIESTIDTYELITVEDIDDICCSSIDPNALSNSYEARIARLEAKIIELEAKMS